MSNKNDATMCNECGSLIIDKAKHRRWHDRVVTSTRTTNHTETTEDEVDPSLFIGRG